MSRRRRLLRAAASFAAGGVLLAVLAATAVAWLLATPAGLRFALAEANRRLPGVQIDYSRIEGPLLGPISVTGLKVKAPGLDLAAESLQLDWSPAALWHRELHVERLSGRGIELELLPEPAAAPATPPSLPSLPLAITIDSAAVNRLRIAGTGPDGATLEIRDLGLAGSWQGRNLVLKRLAATLDATGPLVLTATAELSSDRVLLRQLQLTGPGQVAAHGTLGLGAVRSDLDIDFRDLHWPLQAAPAARQLDQAQGSAHVAGGPEDFGFDVKLAATVNAIAATLEGSGRGTPQSLSFDHLALATGSGRLQGQGSLAWAPLLRADFSAQVAGLDPAILAPGFPGNLNGSLTARTVASGGKAIVDFEAHLAKSTLRGYPLALDTVGTARGTTVNLQSFRLASGSTSLSGQGQVTPPFSASVHFDSPDLGPLYPGLSGDGHFDASLSGSAEAPHVVSRGEAGGLSLPRGKTLARVARLLWNADVDLDPKAAKESSLELSATGLDMGLVVPGLHLAIHGREQYHSLLLEAQTEQGDLSIGLQGGYDRRRREWGGELHSGSLRPKSLAALTLEKPAGLLLGQRRYSLEPACFGGTAGHACADLVHNVFGEATRITWNLAAVQLSALRGLLPGNETVEGAVDGKGDIALAQGDITAAHANLTITGAKFGASGVPPITFLPSHLALSQDRGRLQADVDVQFPQGSVTGEVAAAPAASLEARGLSGRIALNVPDLAVIEPFLAEAKSVGGQLAGSFDFAGTLGAPRFNGRLALSGGRARLVTPGIDLKDMEFSATSDGGPFTLTGSASSGDGHLAVTGTLDFAALPARADLSLKGSGFQAMNTVQGKVWISPDLHLLRDDSGIHLSGDFSVPRAEITPQGLGKGGEAPSADQVIVGAPPPEEKAEIPFFADVNLALGDAVHIEGFGLKTRIEGGIQLHEEPHRLPSGQGELRLIDGSYRAYGQDLSIESGRLIFNGGSVLEPAVDISAVRRPADNISVGVKVRGTLDQPQLTLTSDPVMPREEQLSWLVLGRSLDASSTQDRSLVSAAAMSLGLSGGDYFANQIGKKVGLDQISIGSAPAFSSDVAADPNFAAAQGIQTANNTGGATAAQQSAQLTLGKYLTPKLYVSYGVSLFDSGYVFRLLYDLGHGFKLQGESGTDNGGDIIYTIERGH